MPMPIHLLMVTDLPTLMRWLTLTHLPTLMLIR
jgi:hypothetical protein